MDLLGTTEPLPGGPTPRRRAPYAAEALELEIAAQAPVESLGPFALGRVGRS